jgi:hypothetical protein
MLQRADDIIPADRRIKSRQLATAFSQQWKGNGN